MALLPLLVNEMLLLNDIYDQQFGVGLPTDLDYLRPWRNLQAISSGLSSIKSDDKEFAVKLDVKHFKPEELKVRLDKNYVTVEGKHEERSDEHGFISRQFTRRYRLPDNVLEDTLASNLSSDGILTLHADKKPKEIGSGGREINIVRTNQPALKEEQHKKEEPQKQEEPEKKEEPKETGQQ